MLRRLLRGFLYALATYPLAAIVGGLAVQGLSSNQHDGSVEAVTTGAFIIGPLGAIVAFIAGVLRLSRSADPDSTPPTLHL